MQIAASIKKFALFFGLLLLFASCQRIYTPTVVNQPLIDERGQVQVSGHAGTNGADLQAAGSPADNVVLMFNYNDFTRESPNDTINKPLVEQNVIEVGGGYYKKIGSNDNAAVELVGGYGNGTFENQPESISVNDLDLAEGRFHKFFFQPAIGFYDDIFDAGFANRISVIDHYNVKVRRNGRIQETRETGGDVFWEPAITGRIGYKLVKFQTQIGLSIPVHGQPTYWNQPMWVSVGLHIDIEPSYF